MKNRLNAILNLARLYKPTFYCLAILEVLLIPVMVLLYGLKGTIPEIKELFKVLIFPSSMNDMFRCNFGYEDGRRRNMITSSKIQLKTGMNYQDCWKEAITSLNK